MTKGTHLLRSALLALLALAVISGGSLAAGDLFDDDYMDCPHKMRRLTDGFISDLAASGDAEEEDEVNVSWAATDATTWGLGPNAFDTSFVVILNDGTNHTKTLPLGQRAVTFDGIKTGRSVKVQMAIVVDHADGDYLISDILEQKINQSLTEPSFMADVMLVTTAAVAADPDNNVVGADEVLGTTNGTLYYVGYNENFGNYKADALTTVPSTARLRIGLAHSSKEDDDARDDVDFAAYEIRIEDESGDRVFDHDVATRESSYDTGRNRLVFGTVGTEESLSGTSSVNKFSNARINDDGAIRASVQDGGPAPDPFAADGTTAGTFTAASVQPAAAGLSYVRPATGSAVNTIFANLPDEHRDFPVDILSSDETYTITAWAVNDDDETISPVTTLKVRPLDEAVTLGSDLSDYVGSAVASLTEVNANSGLTSVTITEFTVLK